MEHTKIIARANPYAKWFLLVSLSFICLIGIIYYTRLLSAIQILFAYLIPLFLISDIVLMIILFRLGDGNLPFIPLLVGVVVIIGGASFDMIATIVKSPDLMLEGNAVARAFLDAGFSSEFVYGYSFLAQVLVMILGCTMWASFLRHRKTLIASAGNAGPKSYLEFMKAALGGEHLSWRQYFIPFKLSELPKSYHMLWMVAVSWVSLNLFRWYLSLEWLSGVYGFRVQVFFLLTILSLIGYAVWLKFEYSSQPKKAIQ